jgi:hypothetical protein
MFDPNDTEDLLAKVLLANKKIDANVATATEQVTAARSASVDVLAAMKDATQHKAALEELKGKEIQRAENRNAEIATNLGTNQDAATDVMLKSANVIRESHLKAMDAREKLEKDLSIKVWENPLDWAWAQINMESTIRNAEAATAKRNDVVQGTKQLQEATQQQVLTSNALVKTKTDAMMLEEAGISKADAEIKYKEQLIKNAGMDISAMAQLNSMTATQLQVWAEPRNIRRQEEQDARNKEQHAISMKQAQANLDAIKAAKDSREEEKLGLREMQDLYLAGAKSLEVNRVRMPDRQFAQLIKVDEGAMFYYKRGMQLLASGGEGAPLGNSAGDAAMLIKNTNAPLRAEQKAIKDLLGSTLSEAASGNIIKGKDGKQIMVDPKNPNSVANAATALALKKAEGYLASISQDPNNPYAIAPLPSVLSSVKGIQETAYYQKILKAQNDIGGLKDFDPNQLVGLATAGIKSKQITMDEAVKGLGALFGGATALNNATKQYSKFGLPNQNSLNFQVSKGFGNNKIINLMDAKQLQLHLSSELSNINTAERVRKDTEVNRFPGNFNN